LTAVCAVARAQELPPAAADVPAVAAPPALWSGALSGGYIRTSGNSSTSASNLKFELDYTDLPWRNELSGAAANGHTAGSTSAEQYALGDKLKFNFNEVDYAFGAVTFDSDRFAGISQNFSESGGYGRRLLMTEHQILDAELGAGISEQQSVGETGYDVQPILTVGGKYVYAFSSTSQFIQRLRTEIGAKNTFINPVSQLKLNIVGALFAALNYEVRYNTTVPAESRHTDIITSVNLGYGFGGVKP
jgi:putative salt-induced outer membrane protein